MKGLCLVSVDAGRAPANDDDRVSWNMNILAESTRRGFAIVQVATHQLEHDIRGVSAVAVTLELQGQPTVGP
jgi:hypothetical protein